jgi:hypothetical protein
MDTVTVPVASSWSSKINWTQAVSGLAMLLAWYSGGKINLTGDQQLALVTTIGVITNIVTWVLRTWFTKTVTPSSVPTNAAVVRQAGTQ